MENNELELSLLDGFHEDDHEKINILKKGVSFNPVVYKKIINNDDKTISTCSSSSSFSEDFYNIKNINIDINQFIIENKYFIYFGCTSIIIGAFIKYF
jgi:hypothetical protein